MIDPQTLCADIFTRERMTRLGITKELQGRIVNCFKPRRHWSDWPGPLAGWTLENIIKESSYAHWMRMRNCGPKTIAAINKVLADLGQPTFQKTTPWR